MDSVSDFQIARTGGVDVVVRGARRDAATASHRGRGIDTYARAVDGKPVFETGTIAWGPKEIDRILKAYQ
jgi:hypothetical protein